MNEKFDTRTLRQLVRLGDITEKEYQAHLAALPDEAEEGVLTETRFTDNFARKTAENAEA